MRADVVSDGPDRTRARSCRYRRLLVKAPARKLRELNELKWWSEWLRLGAYWNPFDAQMMRRGLARIANARIVKTTAFHENGRRGRSLS